MTTEEKAKAYDEAIEAMEDCIPDKDGYVTVRPCDIFPELAESEDERTRKDIIHFVQSRLAGFPECERFVTWLEKQGEQKPTENEAKMVGMGGLDMEWSINTLVKKACELFSEYWDGDPDIVEGVAIFEKRMKEFIRKCFYLKKS